MSDPLANLPLRFLRTREAACFLGLSDRTHQPGEPRRDPALPAITSRRNVPVPANAAVHALRQDPGGKTSSLLQ